MDNSSRPLVSHIGIPYHWTQFDAGASHAIAEALAPGHHEIWSSFLDHYPVTEGMADLEAAPSIRALLKAPARDQYSLDKRVSAIHELRDRMNDPDASVDVVDNLLFASDSALVNLLKSNILTLVANGAPPSGHLMYFTSRLHRCLVIVYQVLNTSTVYAAIESSIPKPKTVFDAFDNIDRFTPRARSVLKAMLASGHKLVGHRNTLVHVDRRNDVGVFGPAIDTLYLNEMLYKYLYEYERLDQPKIDFSKFRRSPSDYAGFAVDKTPMFGNVLEIGSGNGLLITSFIQNVAWFDHFVAIDPSINAVNCSYRTSTGQRTDRNQGIGEGKGTYICARFDQDLFSIKFDAVICNPPYIPMPPTHARYKGPFLEAVGGTELLEQVLQSLPHLLSSRGFLFLVCSSLADKEFSDNLPPEIAVEPLGSPEGMEVPFDVESVLTNESWLSWLVENRNLIRRGDVYYHRIKCFALHKGEKVGFEDKWNLLARIRQMNTALATITSTQHEDVANLSGSNVATGELAFSTSSSTDTSNQETILLRFRNLAGSGVDTITEHRQIEDELGSVWWGWWKRQSERTPLDLFRELSRRARQAKGDSDMPIIYMFDTGAGLLYSARLLQIATQSSHNIACPDPTAVPLYYRGQEHAAWFKLKDISPEPLDKLPSFIYNGFPTLTTGSGLLGKNIGGWEELGQSLVTLWLIGIP